MSRQLPLQLLLLLLLCLLLLLHTHTYVFSQPISASLFLEGDFLPEDKGIVLGVIEEEVVEANYLQEDIEENCLSSCLGQLQPENAKAGRGEHQCGERSGDRGDNQRVVAASFWGDMQTGYYRGIVDNIKLTEELYPGWIFRLYVDGGEMKNETKQQLCEVSCSSDIFDLCPVNALPTFGDLSKVFGMTWRFLPVCDPLVSVAMSRDLDSRLTSREEAAVAEWLDSGLPFHVMRDNPYHYTAILGGMWGARMDTGMKNTLDTSFRQLMNSTARSKHWHKGLDQTMLTQWVWPQVKDHCMVHDSYLCKRSTFGGVEPRPFPTRREKGPYNFVGAAGPMELKTVCPEECRPPDHQDWTLC